MQIHNLVRLALLRHKMFRFLLKEVCFQLPRPKDVPCYSPNFELRPPPCLPRLFLANEYHYPQLRQK